jgi:heme A synthase
LGALLVLQGLVAKDTSVARGIVTALHLGNTLGLVAFGALTAWWSNQRNPSWGTPPSSVKTKAVVIGFIAVGMSGAITALGDTLFPVAPTDGSGLWAQLSSELSAAEHFLVRLRIIHPIIAILIAALTVVWANEIKSKARAGVINQLAGFVLAILLVQVLLGCFNVLLHAPGWMQLIHLLVADILWVVVVVTCAELRILKPVTH